MSPLQAAIYAGVLAGLVSGLAYTALFPVIPWLIWGDSPHQGITGALVMVALIWWGGGRMAVFALQADLDGWAVGHAGPTEIR